MCRDEIDGLLCRCLYAVLIMFQSLVEAKLFWYESLCTFDMKAFINDKVWSIFYIFGQFSWFLFGTKKTYICNLKYYSLFHYKLKVVFFLNNLTLLLLSHIKILVLLLVKLIVEIIETCIYQWNTIFINTCNDSQR